MRRRKVYDKKEFIRIFERVNATTVINERIGYTPEPQNQSAFANTELTFTKPEGDNTSTTDIAKDNTSFDSTTPTFAPVIPEGEIPLYEIVDSTTELKFKPKEGFWDVTKYIYGGHFDRFMGGETGKLVLGTVKMGDEIRVQLSDGRTVVCKAGAVANLDFDTVLDLAKANGRTVV